jgi:hypothetical protein
MQLRRPPPLRVPSWGHACIAGSRLLSVGDDIGRLMTAQQLANEFCASMLMQTRCVDVIAVV